MAEIDKEKLEQLKRSKQNLLDKNNKFLFFITESEVASAAIYEIYNHVKILREIGYDAKLLTDKIDYKVPEFLDQDLKALPHITAEGNNFMISPEDFIIVPELFVNVMEQIKTLPCEKIVLFQNFDNALKGLLPGTTWVDYNIRNVITTNKKLTDLTHTYFGPYDTKEYLIGIPEYFKPQVKPKSPVITFSVRNSQEFFKVVKLFYLKYPLYRFISFEDLKGKSREEFAKKLADSFACVWLDDISSFGTTPIEAMKVGTVPIGTIPDIIPEYITEDKDTGFWTNDLLTLPDYLAEIVKMYIQSAIPEKVMTDMKEVSDKYNVKDSKVSIIETYTYFIDKRVNEMQNFISEVEATQLLETK